MRIPVASLEFNENGNTIWIHSPKGPTVLRIKVLGKLRTAACDPDAPVSHCDIVVPGDVKFCIAPRDE
jgi:hypothetical protein